MKSIFSILITAALIVSALTACAGTNMNDTADVRATPRANASAQNPAPATTPKPIDDGSDGSDVNDALQDAGRAVGDAVEGAGNAVGGVVSGVGTAVGDAANGMSDAMGGGRPVGTAAPSTPKR